MPNDKPRLISNPWAQAGLLALVCAAVYWPVLGTGGFVATEGHRAVPAWEMLRSGDWVVTRMFEQAYLRKPPGIAWAIAATSAVLGQDEFGARAAAALAASAMAFVAFAFSWRWFGGRWALAGGLAQALLPWMWTVGRHAEIEAVHQLGVQVGCLALVDALVVKRDRRGPCAAGAWMLVAGLGLAWMVLTKGPAGVPAVGGVALAACAVRRSSRPIVSARLWVPIAIAAAVSGWVFGLIAREIAHSGEVPVMPMTGTHLFGDGWALKALAFVPGALIAMMPASLGMVFPWGPDARAEGDAPSWRAPFETARALTLATLFTLGVYLVSGVTNVRYAMPAAVFVVPIVAYVARGALGGGFVPKRRSIGRWMMLGHPAAIAGVLVVGAWVWIGTLERAQRAKSGRDAGRDLAQLIRQTDADGVWADGVIEARPEVLEAARSGLGGAVEVRWVPGLARLDAAPEGTVLVLRSDQDGDETRVLEAFDGVSETQLLGDGEFGKYRYEAWLVGRETRRP
ncbi:MAG: glycosyltransferase family 39 protein [Phycisphaerales bacterium]